MDDALAWGAAVDGEFANVQSPYFESVHSQRVHAPAPDRERTHGETSDGERANRSCPQGKRAQCSGANRRGTRRARGRKGNSGGAHRQLYGSTSALRRLSLSHDLPCRNLNCDRRDRIYVS